MENGPRNTRLSTTHLLLSCGIRFAKFLYVMCFSYLLEETNMSLVLLIVLVLLLTGSAPVWSYSRSWGYGPMLRD